MALRAAPTLNHIIIIHPSIADTFLVLELFRPSLIFREGHDSASDTRLRWAIKVVRVFCLTVCSVPSTQPQTRSSASPSATTAPSLAVGG